MAATKQYASPEKYERKLELIMKRMGATEYNYDFSRHGAWVEFRIKGQLYRFDHTKEKAAALGIKLNYGSDCFAQIVLALEDLARMAERGIYELQTWLSGMKYLPPPEFVPDSLRALGFEEIPASAEDVKARFKLLAKKAHPDAGGTEERFISLQQVAHEAIKYMEERERTYRARQDNKMH